MAGLPRFTRDHLRAVRLAQANAIVAADEYWPALDDLVSWGAAVRGVTGDPAVRLYHLTPKGEAWWNLLQRLHRPK